MLGVSAVVHYAPYHTSLILRCDAMAYMQRVYYETCLYIFRQATYS